MGHFWRSPKKSKALCLGLFAQSSENFHHMASGQQIHQPSIEGAQPPMATSTPRRPASSFLGMPASLPLAIQMDDGFYWGCPPAPRSAVPTCPLPGAEAPACTRSIRAPRRTAMHASIAALPGA